MTGSLVSAGTRQRVRDLATPVATALGRLGLTPNALTLIGFAGTAVAAIAAAYQWWLAAGILVLAFGIFDLFDGALARATGRASKLGAFLDSVFDRWGEGLVYGKATIREGAAEFHGSLLHRLDALRRTVVEMTDVVGGQVLLRRVQVALMVDLLENALVESP